VDRDSRIADVSQLLDEWAAVVESGTFEDALEALERIVAILDEGDLTLDLSVRCFETGTRLSERCQQLLEAAELRISVLSTDQQYDAIETDEADPWTMLDET
jgi:exodeoxyribonuclease VII small subunit